MDFHESGSPYFSIARIRWHGYQLRVRRIHNLLHLTCISGSWSRLLDSVISSSINPIQFRCVMCVIYFFLSIESFITLLIPAAGLLLLSVYIAAAESRETPTVRDRLGPLDDSGFSIKTRRLQPGY
ncbi:hypothetical protein GALMADRAFT_1178603 [Galerina marginata CBS 339.88]|uniref:Uncharacterized protein n=1 Tax=Galerina marginata (strain CBS 339.88) TaxID=685588 RepID=A0A067TCL8_GALM3|nr:hypothetical protein GALMADRAFT_1178603 [Galerina marginata CBS 339.88]